MVRIQHVSIEVGASLIEEEVSFWGILGFDQVDPPEGIGAGSVWMEAGDQQVHLLPRPGTVLPGSGHLALVADDFDGTVEALRGAGLQVTPGEPYWGSPRVKVTAPSGHLVELMEFAPA